MDTEETDATMEQMCASYCVKLSEFQRNPSRVKNEAGMNPVAVLSRNSTAFYIIDPEIYESLLAAARNNRQTLPQTVAAVALRATNQELVTDIESNPKFGSLVSKILESEQSRVARGELSAKALRITEYRLEKFVLPFFSQILVADIQLDHLQKFIDSLAAENLGGISIGQYLVIVRKVLKYAHSMQLINKLPSFPSVRSKRVSRGAFTLQEYQVLLKASWQLRDQDYANHRHNIKLRTEGLDINDLIMVKDMRRLIGFMVNSFVRPSDIRLMQHKHIEIINRDQKYLRLSLPETKSHDKPIVTMRSAVSIYDRILRDAKNSGFGRPNDYVFLPFITNRDYALRIMGFLFNWLLASTGLKRGPHGTGRTLYSLRHTSITFRLLYGQGIDLLTLARNARTSVEMIERHYASTLNGEMNVALIQSKRKKKSDVANEKNLILDF